MPVAKPTDTTDSNTEQIAGPARLSAHSHRALRQDLAYITGWKRAVFGRDLAWPENARVAMRFILDHSIALHDAPGSAQEAALELMARGLRRSLDRPAPATLDRRIASWKTLHRERGMASAFDLPGLKQARIAARGAANTAAPVTRDLLQRLLASCDDSLRGRRDRAMLMLAFAAGGRGRAEVVALSRADIFTEDFAASGVTWLRIGAGRLAVKGAAARAVQAWISEAAISDGPLFRPISKAGRAINRPLAADALRVILRHRLRLAGLPEDHVTPRGLRSGFMMQAARDAVPMAEAMRMAGMTSANQAARYYRAADGAEGSASDLLG